MSRKNPNKGKASAHRLQRKRQQHGAPVDNPAAPATDPGPSPTSRALSCPIGRPTRRNSKMKFKCRKCKKTYKPYCGSREMGRCGKCAELEGAADEGYEADGEEGPNAAGEREDREAPQEDVSAPDAEDLADGFASDFESLGDEDAEG